jgi:sporulation protein YlmC with PRC-barrel domain
MSRLRLVRRLGALAVFASLPLAASAQTPPPSAPPSTPPAATKPETAPVPQTTPSTQPTMPARPGDKSATAPAKTNSLVGLSVFSSDGSKVGSVHSVNAEPGGKVKAIHIKSGGFLGIGGKLVAIPDGKFTKVGDNIQLGLTSDEVSKLPEVKEQG